jgi:hypothetical protein
MEVRAKRMAPAIINFFSGIFERALPTMGLRTNEEIPKAPIRIPISISVDPNLERYIGRVGIRMKETDVKANCAEKQRMKSRVNIFWIAMIHVFKVFRYSLQVFFHSFITISDY